MNWGRGGTDGAGILDVFGVVGGKAEDHEGFDPGSVAPPVPFPPRLLPPRLATTREAPAAAARRSASLVCPYRCGRTGARVVVAPADGVRPCSLSHPT